MDIKQLQYFLQVSKDGNVTKAAAALYISQQALSSSLARLEKELGCILMKRNSRGIILTSAGEYFKIQAQKIIDMSNETQAYLNSLKAKKPNLIVGCSYGVVGELTGQLLNNPLLFKHQIHIKIMEYPDCDCEQAVENENVDLGFAIGPIDNNKFDSYLLIKRHYCFVVNKSHPLAKYDLINIRQLQDENIISMNEHFKAYHILLSLCKKEGFQPKFIYEAGEIAPIQDLVLKNYGVGTSTDFVASKFQSPNIKILYVENPAFLWAVYLISKKEKVLSKEAQTFIDCIRKNSLN
jgi:DNA-binding transcriptional LysR family regulator